MDHKQPPFIARRPITRRRFVQGLALVGCGSTRLAHSGTQPAAGPPPGLATSPVSLVIGSAPINITGHARMATLANDSIPGPCLRLRQGELLSARVTNHLSEPTSIHWHGIRLPSSQDGCQDSAFAAFLRAKALPTSFP